MKNGSEVKKENNSHWKASAAGSFANICSQVLYPLENVKFRFQASNLAKNNPIPAYKGIYDAINNMYKTEGFGSLYRGVVINAVAGSVANSIFFYVYSDGKKKYNFDPEKPYGFNTMLISYRAGLASMFVTTPFWTVKTRVILF